MYVWIFLQHFILENITNLKSFKILFCEREQINLLRLLIIELTHSKTILEITVEIESQPAVLDFKNLSQYSIRSK